MGDKIEIKSNISDWIIRMKNAKDYFDLIPDAELLHSEKLVDYDRLRNSALPRFDDFQVDYSQFTPQNNALMEFMSKYESFVVRGIPKTSANPRRFLKDVKTFQECSDFLKKEMKIDDFTVLLTEYEENMGSGIIISRQNDLMIEVSDESLDMLSSGKATPKAAGFYKEVKPTKFKRMVYESDVDNEKYREIAWRALNYIRIDKPFDLFQEIEFMKGYFEFVHTIKDKIKFLDYKVNKRYLA